MGSTLIAEKKLALNLAEQAGKIISENFTKGLQNGHDIKLKADRTLLTKTDTDINELVINVIRKEFPEHTILGEEKSLVSKDSNMTWVCDPVDGTSIFTYGIPLSVFSLALVKDGVPVVGVVNHPFMKQMFSAEIGQGAHLNQTPLKVSQKDKLEGNPIGVVYWRSTQARIEPVASKLNKLGSNVLQLGSIAYMGALVSNGSFVASIHPAEMPYDSAALKVIIEEAGGKVTNLSGKDQRYDQKIDGCIMSNGVLHDEILRLIKE